MAQVSVKHLLHPESQLFSSLLKKLDNFNRWNALLAGFAFNEPKLLEHCQIVRIDNTTLIMLANNPHWAARLRFYIPDLLTFLRNYPEFSLIKTIQCKIRPLQYSAKILKPDDNKLTIKSSDILADIIAKVGR